MEVVCMRNCKAEYVPGSTYYFKEGEIYTWDGETKIKTISRTMYNKAGKYNGYVDLNFVEQNFILEEEFNNILGKVDELFDQFLRNKLKIKNIKKQIWLT